MHRISARLRQRLRRGRPAAVIAACLVGLAIGRADAQTTFQTPPPTRGFIAVNAVFQPASTSFSDRFEFQEFVETGTIDSSFSTKAAFGFDGFAGIRLWRNVGVAAGLSTSAPGSRDDRGGEVSARIPHPFDFNKHREVSGQAGMRHQETAIHGSLLYFVPAGTNIQAVLGAGPTFFQADQSFVRDVLYDHAYPYDTATFRGVDLDNESASGFGFNASLDVTWRFARSFGAGALVRYTRATLPFTPADREVKVDVGGVQAGVGLRIIF